MAAPDARTAEPRPPRAALRRPARLIAAGALAAGVFACDGPLFDPGGRRAVTAVTVTPATLTIPAGRSVFADSVGELTAVARAREGAPNRRRAVRWASSDSAVARVSPAGIVTGRAPGRAEISATVGAVRGWATVTVVAAADTGIVVAAHRGFRALFPENTLIAIDSALARGADAAEIDVWVTRDSVLMLMHDPTVDRTTNGTGQVWTMTSVQLRALDACSKAGPQWASCAVPTLRSALRVARRRRGRLLLDLKGPYPGFALEEMLAEIYAAKMQHRVVVTSFDLGQLRAMRQLDPEIPLGYLTNGLTPLDSLAGVGRSAALPDEQSILAAPTRTRVFVGSARDRGVDVATWTVVGMADARALVALGVRRLISDVPLEKKALRP